jgi:CrcB protein
VSRPSSHPGAEVALVAVGGALGSLARWGLAEALPSPTGTLVANVSGCFAIGVLAAWLFVAHPRLRLLVGVGFLGGYTTFSTHLLEAHGLLDRPGPAAAYVGGTLVGCLAAAAAGTVLGRRLPGASA